MNRCHSRTRGFSIVEVLVSLIIIAVGMLGLAKIEALSYASTGIASKQSLAAFQAASLASAMRANRNYWASVTTPYYFSSPAGANSNTDSGMSVTSYATSGACVSTASGVGSSAPCTAAILAAYDLQSWLTTLKATLPNPTTTITCPTVVAPAQLGCYIQITWAEENVAANANSLTASGLSNAVTAPTYTLYVVP